MSETSQESWFYAPGGAERRGPVPFDELRQLLASGQLRGDDLVWKAGMANWAPAQSVDGLVSATPPPLPVGPPPAVPPPMPQAPPVPMPMRPAAAPKRSSATLAVVAVAVGVGGIMLVGIIAAILIPNFLDALQKAKQKRTVADIRNMGTAYMSWLTDQVGAASAGQTKLSLEDYSSLRTPEEIRADLHPSDTFFYMNDIPFVDGWGHPLEVWMSDNILGAQVFLIRSPGRDGVFQSDTEYTAEGFGPTDYDQDIVWADGYFVRWPNSTRR